MPQSTLSTQAIADQAQTPSPAPVTQARQISPQVIETGYAEEKTTPQIFYITAIHPDRAVEQTERLMILMENQWESEESLVDLSTNATGFLDVIKAVRTHSKFKSRSWQFVESWVPSEDEF